MIPSALLFLGIGTLGEVAFAIWARACAKEDAADPGFSSRTAESKRAERLQATQWVSTYVRVLELVAFFGFAVTSGEWVKDTIPRAIQLLPAAGFYFSLALAHALIRGSLERKLRAVEVPAKDAVSRAGRAWTGTILMFASYLGAFQAASFTLRTLIGITLGEAVGAKAIWITFPLSLLIGLGFSYWISPFLIRVMFVSRPLTDATLTQMLNRCFQKAQISPPTFWVLDMDRQKAHNAMVAGLRSGRGPFRPALFFTRSLAEQLTPLEFEAVILHEVSHLALKHMVRRLYWSVGALFLAFLTGSAILYVSAPLIAREWHSAAAMVAIAFSFWAQMATLRRQVRRQELEADAHAVFTLGADLDSLASALTKITQMNDHQMGQKDPSSYFNPASAHPTPDQRIMKLRAMQALHASRDATVTSSPSEQKAA